MRKFLALFLVVIFSLVLLVSDTRAGEYEDLQKQIDDLQRHLDLQPHF